MAPKSHKGLLVLAVLVMCASLMVVITPAVASPSIDSQLLPSSAERAKIKLLRKHESKSMSTIHFWRDRTRGRWALHLRHDKCWQVHGKQRRKVCIKARKSLAAHTARLHSVGEQLEIYTAELGNLRDWTCLHHHEGDWEDGGHTYWGGLQMDLDFMEAHGRDMLGKYGYPRGWTGPNGWQNPWTPREQVIVAQRAKLGIRTSLSGGRVVFWQDRPRGYGPWPNTRKECGI